MLEMEMANLSVRERDESLKRIEAVCERVAIAIANGKVPDLTFFSRASWNDVSFSEHAGIDISEEKKMVQIKLDHRRSIKTFAFMMKVLAVMHRLIQEDKYCTKRDLFYQNPGLFGSQAVIDNIIDNVACMLEIPRWKLHILGTCKGLVAGDLQFYDSQGHHVDCNHTKMGVQIPSHDKDMHHLYSTAKFVLVLEKDATFQKLLTEDFCHSFNKVIIITGKGYPDIGTRLLVKRIWEEFQLPVFILVDADPDGIEIMLVYKYGSKAQAFENQFLAVPELKWIGILPTDLPRLSIKNESLLPLTDRDLQKLALMLQRSYVLSNSKIAEQIEKMIQSGQKAEVQSLDSINTSYLTKIYLPRKVQSKEWF